MKNIIIKTFVTLFAFFTLSACGPSYNIKHTYTPPITPAAKNCTMQCKIIENQCTQNNLLREQLCGGRSSVFIGTGRGYHKRGNRGHRHSRIRSGLVFNHNISLSNSCYDSRRNCKAEFNQCYQSCGGSVKTERVCVSGCQ